MMNSQITLASLSTLSCVLYKRSEHEVISLMIYLITPWSKILRLLSFVFYVRFLNACTMLLSDPLCKIVDSTQKISPHF